MELASPYDKPLPTVEVDSLTCSLLEKNLRRGSPCARKSIDHDQNKHEQTTVRQQEQHVLLWFSGLLVTTIWTIFLMITEFRGITFTGSFYTAATQHRATSQIIVQVISTLLGAVQMAALARAFNYATRLRMSKPVSVASLSFWTSINHRSLTWSLPIWQLLPLLLVLAIGTIPSAIWAGAISPIVTTTTIQAYLWAPAYNNISNIHQWPAEVGKSGPTLRTNTGFYSYSPSVFSAGDLTHALATATTPDGSPRLHAKLDDTRWTYIGRSYGVGAPVGLTDSFALSAPNSYVYQEMGYDAQTTCIYNYSSTFILAPVGGSYDMLWEARGRLPDSPIGPGDSGLERNTYVGHGADSIVALGSTYNLHNGTRYLGIAAGLEYGFLNSTQCQTMYLPALFEISVDVTSKNITVAKVQRSNPIDIDPTGNISHSTHRQITAFSDHMTNLYQSEIGNSINSSISEYRTLTGNLSSDDDTVLGGLTNSITAAIDDVLLTYAGAQIMIQGAKTLVPAQVNINAVRLGEQGYILATFIINTIIVLLVLVEAIRTKVWRNLTTFDYCDPQCLVYAACRDRSSLQPEHDMVTLVTGGYTYSLVGHRSGKQDLEG